MGGPQYLRQRRPGSRILNVGLGNTLERILELLGRRHRFKRTSLLKRRTFTDQFIQILTCREWTMMIFKGRTILDPLRICRHERCHVYSEGLVLGERVRVTLDLRVSLRLPSPRARFFAISEAMAVGTKWLLLPPTTLAFVFHGGGGGTIKRWPLAASSADLLTQGNDLYLRGELEAAQQCYRECVSMGEYPVACDCAVNLGSVALDLSGDDAEAEKMYRLALEATERGAWNSEESGESGLHLDAAQNLASLLQGRAMSRDMSLDSRRGLLFEAASLYKKVVREDSERWDAWANLGSALLDADAPPLDAARCLQRAIIKAEAIEAAMDVSMVAPVRRALANAYYGLGSALSLVLDDEQLLKDAVTDTDLLLFTNEGPPRTLVSESTANCFRTSVSLAEDFQDDDMVDLRAKATHSLDAVTGNQATNRASPTFVKALFDGFAPTFDDQLVQTLDYQVPKLLADRLDLTDVNLVLDAGCGTGLFGAELKRRRPESKIIGVDLSENMCDLARVRLTQDNSTAVYDTVLVGDLCDDAVFDAAALEGSQYFDLIAAADVFCYLGDLTEVLRRFVGALRPGGQAIFTVETLLASSGEQQSWVLQRNGRYAHAASYVRDLGTSLGFHCDAAEDVVARKEQGIPVPATLFLLTKKTAT